LEYVRAGARRPTTIINGVIGDDQYIKRHLPTVWLKQQHQGEIKETPENEGVVISCSKIRQKKNGMLDVKTITSTFVIRHQAGMPAKALDPTRALVEVGNVFSFLHAPLVETSLFNDILELPVLSPREYLEMRCRLPQQRLLDRALLAISTGNSSFNDDLFLTPNKQDHQKQYLSAITSTDILLRTLRGNPGTPGHFQLMFGELLNRQRLTRDFRDLCSALNLAPSRKFTLKSRAESVLTHLREGIDLGLRDLVVLLFDNVGFKILGRQASYDQWIMMNIVILREDTLKAAGFYQCHNQISRAPSHIWEDVIKDITIDDATELAERIVGIQNGDFERLSICVMENIRYVLDFQHELSLDDQLVRIALPCFDRIVTEETRIEMDELLRIGHPTRVRTDTRHRHGALIPRNHIPNDVTDELGGSNILRHVDDAGIVGGDDELSTNNIASNRYVTNNATLQAVHEDLLEKSSVEAIIDYMVRSNKGQLEKYAGIVGGDDELSTNNIPSNRYVTNNATLQAVHEDLSEKSSIEAIIDYMVRSNKGQLEKWDEVKDKCPNNAEPPLAEVMIGCGCDGQPAVAMRRILAEDARCNRSERLYPDTIFVSFGGFHTIMKGLNASGEYFEELLKDIWSSFHDSWDKVKWILFPTDPRQRESDYSWCLLANYAVAAMNLRQHQKRDVSAVEVHEFMLERAREFPICALALLEIRIGSVLKLMRNSEKLGRRGCVETFFSAIRLIMPLFAVTHKSDYMYLCQDLLKWHHCASPAQRKIYEEFIFTQLTANESSIFHDTFVELSVMVL
jgi:hypothetical protein